MGGMRTGTGSSPFEDEDEETEEEDVADTTADRPTSTETSSTRRSESATTDPSTEKDDLPYIFRRERVTEDREQTGIRLQAETVDLLDELVDEQDGRFDRAVQKTDVKEAAIIAAAENPEIVADVLERWGYGM